MKKLFGQSRKPYDEEVNRDEWDYGEDEYSEDEVYEGEAEEGVDYTDEEYTEEGGYYADGEYTEEGEYYADEEYADEDGYYADEEYAGEGGYDAEGEYAGEGEYDAEGEYAEEGEYYAEGEYAEDGEYYEDGVNAEEGGYYADEEYAGEDEYYEEAESSEDEIYEDDVEYEDDEDDIDGPGFFGRMSGMDKVITATGLGVLLLALVTGGFYIGANMEDKQVSSFDTVGAQLSGIQMIGETGLFAVADAVSARIEAENAAAKEEEKDKEYNENDYTQEVNVVMNMTSIKNDLKLKFVNKRTKKLIGNVPFSVTVTKPDGGTETWTDDDMDGIIYKKGIDAGDYSIVVAELEGKAYQDYNWPDSKKKAEVKADIEYEKVDVADEIKKESEINVKEEDTAKKDTVVESELKDTVTWVESTKSTTYVAVSKNQVAEPVVAGLGTMFYRLAGEMSISGAKEMAPGEELQLAVSKAADYAEWTISEEKWVSDSDVVTVDQAGLVKAAADIKEAKNVTITYTCTLTEPVEQEEDNGDESGSTGDEETDVSGGDVLPGTPAEPVEPAPPRTINVTVVHQITVSPKVLVKELTVSPATLKLDLTKGVSTGELTASITVTDETVSKDVVWSSSDEKVATVKVENGKVIVTAVAAGKATITATSVADEKVFQSCEVTVVGTALTGLQLDKTAETLYVGGTLELKATTTPEGCPVTWKSMNEEIATVDEKGKVTGVAEGETEIVVTGIDATGEELTAKCKVTITKVMILNKTTLTVIVGGENTIEATFKDDGKGVLKAFSADPDSLTVEIKGNNTVVFKGHMPKESVGVTILYTTSAGENIYQNVYIKVVSNTNKLTDATGQQLYILTADGKYVEAVASDYYKYDTFYVQTVRYTGWQTFNGNVYFFDVDGRCVTGEQIIQGAKYNFASDGTLITGAGTMGIDVSKWNGSIDWNAVKNSGVSYVIIRCGYRGSSSGALVEDPKFKTNIKGATAAGLKVGVYFFTQATDEIEAIEEASMVLEMIDDYKISYPVFLDVEASGGRGDKIDAEERTAVIKAFCETIEDSGYTAGVYANKTWYEKKMNADELTKYKIWLAQYAAQPTYTETRIDMWQYKETGKVSGISGNVDLNLSYLGY